MVEKRSVTVLADLKNDEVEVLQKALEAMRGVCASTIHKIMGWGENVTVDPTFFNSEDFQAFAIGNTPDAPQITVSLGNPCHAGYEWSNYGEAMDTLLDEQNRDFQEWCKRKFGR